MLLPGYETKTGEVRTSVIFNVERSSATSMESSRRDLLNDVAEQRPILKNNQNTSLFWFYTQNRYSIPQTGVLFLLCWRL